MATGLLLCDDLLFTSRISGEARALDLTVKSARSVEKLIELARQEMPSCVLIDLGVSGFVLSDLLDGLREVCSPLPRLVAYGSHVDAARLQAARAAGCDPVLPRSKLVEELPRSLATWMTLAEG